MYISHRAAQVRNVLVAIANGSITLVILLIAPLGLASVIFNTLLVTVATYATTTVGDRVVGFLIGSPQQAELLSRSESSSLRRTDSTDDKRF